MRMALFTHAFVISGLNLERFVNLMRKQDIPLLSLQRQDARTLACECYSSDLATIAALVQEKGWRMEQMRPLRLSAFLVRLKKRPGIPIGILLMLIGAMVFSQFVWRVEVKNAGPYQADVVSFLQESGYHAGVRRSTVDVRALESALLQRYPRIAWFHAYVAGMTLVVEVTPGVAAPEPSGAEAGNLVADRNGIVHSIRVFAGTAAVKAGDVVQKGDVLIRGWERGRDGQETAVHADGVVMARCWESFTVQTPTTEIISTETGRQSVSWRIHTPLFDWPSAEEEAAFLSSNLYVDQLPVASVFLPVFVQIITRREVSMEYVQRDMDLVRQEAHQAALKQLKNALFDDEIIDKWVDYCMIEDDTLAATVTAERLVDIGAFSSP